LCKGVAHGVKTLYGHIKSKTQAKRAALHGDGEPVSK
jgi:hypothetical protein